MHWDKIKPQIQQQLLTDLYLKQQGVGCLAALGNDIIFFLTGTVTLNRLQESYFASL